MYRLKKYLVNRIRTANTHILRICNWKQSYSILTFSLCEIILSVNNHLVNMLFFYENGEIYSLAICKNSDHIELYIWHTDGRREFYKRCASGEETVINFHTNDKLVFVRNGNCITGVTVNGIINQTS